MSPDVGTSAGELGRAVGPAVMGRADDVRALQSCYGSYNIPWYMQRTTRALYGRGYLVL